MGLSQKLPSFGCQLRIIQVHNVKFNTKGKGDLFTRFYLSAGNNKRIQMNTRKISSKSVPFWDEPFCLECSCTQELLETLKQESLVLEVRQSNTCLVLGKVLGSHLLGRAEIPWKKLFESPKMEYKEWVKMDLDTGNGVKPLKLQVEIKIQVPSTLEKEDKITRRRSMKMREECGCEEFGHGHDHNSEIFALAAALEAF